MRDTDQQRVLCRNICLSVHSDVGEVSSMLEAVLEMQLSRRLVICSEGAITPYDTSIMTMPLTEVAINKTIKLSSHARSQCPLGELTPCS